jgi:hypothetical protein
MAFLSPVLLAAALAIGTGPQKPGQPVGLRPLDFEAAQQAARIEHKPILMLFCADSKECQKLSSTTLTERHLRTWMDEKVVAIQVDPRQEVELARRYRVRTTPTFLFADAKGTELDRIMGVRDSKGLRTEGDEILKGGDPLERLQKRRKGREADPDLRLRYADILSDRALLEQALTEYLAVHALGGTAGQAAFDEIVRLGRIYPKAMDAIGGLASTLEPRVQRAEASDEEFERWLGLCKAATLDARLVWAYDALAQVEGPQVERAGVLRARLAAILRDVFYTDKRYADLAPLVTDVRAKLEARQSARAAELAAAPGDANLARRSLQTLREDTSRDYEVLVALKRLGEATLLADALIGFDPTVATYDTLIEHALRADSLSEAKALAVRGRADPRIDAKARLKIGPTVLQQAR